MNFRSLSTIGDDRHLGLPRARNRRGLILALLLGACAPEQQQADANDPGVEDVPPDSLNAADCGGAADGGVETRTRFAAAVVPYGQSCQSEEQTRTCNDGAWSAFSGGHAEASCEVTPPAGCDGAAHGSAQTRIRYANGAATFPSRCLSEEQTRTCYDGTWSAYDGSYLSDACVYTDNVNQAFLTKQRYNGNLGGISGGDAICQAEAEAAGFQGVFYAFLATNSQSAMDRFSSVRGWYRPDGRPFADQLSSAALGAGFYPPALDADGGTVTSVPSAYQTLTHWVGKHLQNCGEWTMVGTTGSRGAAVSASDWDDSGPAVQCLDEVHLLCLEITYNHTISAPLSSLAGARLSFVTTAEVAGTADLNTLDALCQSEFETVHGTSTGRGPMRALVGTSTASAASRFNNPSGPNWARPDGVLVAASSNDFLQRAWLAPLNLTASGSVSGAAFARIGGFTEPMRPACDTDTQSAVITHRFFINATTPLQDCTLATAIFCAED